MYLLACAAVFTAAYLLNITWISVFYHRALAHKAIDLSPRMRRFVVSAGPWITGMDPKAWVAMHRLHHIHSDTDRDPHSPATVGIFGVLLKQLQSYTAIQRAIVRKDPAILRRVRDLDFDSPAWMYNRTTALLPYVVHASIAVAFATITGWWLLGAAFWLGMMSHPIQGWLINSFGHAVGPRNFDLDDDSRNPWILGLLIAGEGFQNNHHAFPASAKFSFRWWEIDPGWGIVRGLDLVGLASIRHDKLIPTPKVWAEKTAARRKLAGLVNPAGQAAEALLATLQPMPRAVVHAATETALDLLEQGQELTNEAADVVRQQVLR